MKRSKSTFPSFQPPPPLPSRSTFPLLPLLYLFLQSFFYFLGPAGPTPPSQSKNGPNFSSFPRLFLTATLALPAAEISKEASCSILQSRADAYEWTALGDSYASGVGAGHMDDGSQRCVRFSEAYPRLMQIDNCVPGGAENRKINNVICLCSGTQAKDVLEQQFYDSIHIPHLTDITQAQFGPRLPFGKPRIATLSIGGNDIDLKGLIMNCVYRFFPTHTCATQQAISWKKIDSPDLVNGIDAVIKKTVAKGREGLLGRISDYMLQGMGS